MVSEGLSGADTPGFTFDRVFGVESQQQEIFDWGVKGIVEGWCWWLYGKADDQMS